MCVDLCLDLCQSVSVCVCVCVYVCVCVHLCVYVYICLCICLSVYRGDFKCIWCVCAQHAIFETVDAAMDKYPDSIRDMWVSNILARLEGESSQHRPLVQVIFLCTYTF